jgi:hypothetical protein
LVFVEPVTLNPAAVDSFSLWMGMDPVADFAEQNRIIIEAFDSDNTCIVDYLTDRLVYISGSVAEFAGEMGDAVPQPPWDFSLDGCSCRGDGTERSG